MNERESLVHFHHTISEQLNARLAESPRFFWALVAVSTGYGYVAWNSNPSTVCEKWKHVMVIAAGALCWVAVLWASWYLTALGYAFRFLQNSQHCIEHALGWNPDYIPKEESGRATGQPPERSWRRHPLWPFWLLPGIYAAHAAALCFFLLLICATSTFYAWQSWPQRTVLVPSMGICALILGAAVIVRVNIHYFDKFDNRRRNPKEIYVLPRIIQTPCKVPYRLTRQGPG